MKNYYANDNIMRITCEDETNLLHIIENGGLYPIIKEGEAPRLSFGWSKKYNLEKLEWR